MLIEDMNKAMGIEKPKTNTGGSGTQGGSNSGKPADGNSGSGKPKQK